MRANLMGPDFLRWVRHPTAPCAVRPPATAPPRATAGHHPLALRRDRLVCPRPRELPAPAAAAGARRGAGAVPAQRQVPLGQGRREGVGSVSGRRPTETSGASGGSDPGVLHRRSRALCGLLPKLGAGVVRQFEPARDP